MRCKSISFLDLMVTLPESERKKSVHLKATSFHKYLHYSSSHTEHIKRSVVSDLILKISRLYSEEKDFGNHTSKLRFWFLERENPRKKFEKEMNTIKFF